MNKKFRIRKTNKFNYWTILFKSARGMWARADPMRKKCLELGRMREGTIFKFRCFHCASFFHYSEIEIDHITPIGNSQPQTREEYFECLEKLLVPVDNLQILCLSCHTSKTTRELNERKK